MTQPEKEFRLIYEVHYVSLCRIAYRILSEEDTAREVVQEVFIEIWKKQNWQELRSVQAYLITAVYNRSLKALRKQKKLVSLDQVTEPVAVDVPLEQQELEIVISRGIEQLPERCREIFLLSRESELTYNQIAIQLGISIKTVEAQMGIALKKLREHLYIHGN